jgi:hypothetical protein
MGIAASEGVIVWNPATRGESKANLIADIHAAASQAGWGSETIAGGYKYTLASKQSLGCKAKIWDEVFDGFADRINLQFMSLDETLVGGRYQLAVRPARLFQLHVNRCQIFVSVAGVSNSASSDVTSLQGGIPFIPESELGECGVDIGPTLTTEAWWSSGDAASGADNFRNSRRTASWSACHNGNLMNTSAASYSELARLRLVPVTLAVNTDFFFSTVQQTRHLGSDEPLYLDPLIQWGSGAVFDSVALVRGQLYDAMMPSIDKPLDFEVSRCEVDWINYMHDDNLTLNRSKYGSLYLMKGVTPAAARRGNYVY